MTQVYKLGDLRDIFRWMAWRTGEVVSIQKDYVLFAYQCVDPYLWYFSRIKEHPNDQSTLQNIQISKLKKSEMKDIAKNNPNILRDMHSTNYSGTIRDYSDYLPDLEKIIIYIHWRELFDSEPTSAGIHGRYSAKVCEVKEELMKTKTIRITKYDKDPIDVTCPDCIIILTEKGIQL